MHDYTAELDPELAAFEREHIKAHNAEVLAGVPRSVVDLIVANDPRYLHHNPDGTVRLRDEVDGDEDVTVDEYLAIHEINLAEVFYATLDDFLGNIKNQTIVPRGDVVDVLLDLRRVFHRFKDEQKKITRGLLDAMSERVGFDEEAGE